MNIKKILTQLFSLQSIFSFSDAKKENLFSGQNILLAPAVNKRDTPIEQPKYSEDTCESILERDNNILIYSRDCAEMTAYPPGANPADFEGDDKHDILESRARRNYDLAPETLKELAESADNYWCKGMGEHDFDCSFSTETDGEKKPSTSINVCGVVNYEQLASSIHIEEASSAKGPYTLRVNGENDEHRHIKISLAHVDDLERSIDGIGFNVYDPTTKTRTGDSVSKTFNHEIGHAAFQIAHPKNAKTDSIMHPMMWVDKDGKKMNTDTTVKMAKEDVRFAEKCIGRKENKDREL